MYNENKNSFSLIEKMKNYLIKKLLSKELLDVWINSSEIFSIINDLFPTNLNKRYPVIRNLLPILDSFFIIVTIMNSAPEAESEDE